jgi:hypothetical protein
VNEKNCFYTVIIIIIIIPIVIVIKVTDCNELENLAEFSIFIKSSAPGGDADIWAIKFILVIQK